MKVEKKSQVPSCAAQSLSLMRRKKRSVTVWRGIKTFAGLSEAERMIHPFGLSDTFERDDALSLGVVSTLSNP